MNMKINNKNSDIILELLPENAEAYIVGGYLRDFILDTKTYDIDYVLIGVDIIEFGKTFANKVQGHFVLLDEKNEIVRVVLPDKIHFVDFAKCFGKSIKEDLSRRDFSINAMAYDIKNHKLIDIYNGINDIKNKTVRIFDTQNILDDPLRILRAYRFASKYAFEIEKTSAKILDANYKLMNKNKIAKERIQIEFLKLLEGKNSAQTLQKMKDNKFLYEIFDELQAQENVPPNSHHHLKLIDHSIETIHQLENLISEEPKWVQTYINQDFIPGITRLSFLKLATLLHDIGKPQTWEIEPESGRHRFIKHDEIGAQMAKKTLKKLKYSNNQIKYITKLIKHHIYPSHLLRSDVSEKAVLRMFRRLEEETVDTILLAKADRLSAKGEEITDAIIKKNMTGLSELLEKYKIAKETLKPLEKLISGDEIMKILNIKADEKLGNIIKELKEAQISGDVITKEDAVNFILRL
ncbi:MAG: HD domain-containing protein [bacterium]